jgi:hypothetical protein
MESPYTASIDTGDPRTPLLTGLLQFVRGSYGGRFELFSSLNQSNFRQPVSLDNERQHQQYFLPSNFVTYTQSSGDVQINFLDSLHLSITEERSQNVSSEVHEYGTGK